MNVSKESRDFLDRLSIYLITSGKNEKRLGRSRVNWKIIYTKLNRTGKASRTSPD
ncbi:hypothetical protein ACPJHQ_07860 [Rossellomorea sp. H39__3]